MTLTYMDNIELRAVQFRRRKLLASLIVMICFLLPFVCAVWLHSNPLFYSQVEHFGILLIIIAIAGRTFSALHIGGYKKEILIETGPYSVVRNPLYLSTLIGAAGIGAQTSSLVMIVICTAATAIVFGRVVAREEQYLRLKFGSAFEEYAARVPRFIPSFSKYRDVDQLVVQPKFVYRTFLESSCFLIAIPVIDAIELARFYGWIPDVLHIP